MHLSAGSLMFDGNASSIEKALMLFALIAVIAAAPALLYLFTVLIRRRNRQRPVQSFLDIIGRK
jgi:hypothetical protein